MKILFLSRNILFPLDSGGKIRSTNILNQLNKEFDLDIISILKKGEEEYIPQMRKLCRNFIYLKRRKSNKIAFYFNILRNLFSIYPYALINDYDSELHKQIKNISKRYDLLICDFLFPALNCMDINVPKILFQHNVEFMIYKRNFQTQRGLKKLMWYLQYVKTKRIEKIITNKFDHVICVSKKDLGIHRKLFNIKNSDYVDLGVEVDDYKNNGIKKEEKSLIFTGSMDWTPNSEAVKWFYKEIFFKLKGFKFYAVGKNPKNELKKLNRKDFIITGRVQDIRPYLFKGEIYVVPLRSGGGTRIKIFEAMAAKIPVVSTTVGAEGLPVVDGKNIIIADTPKEILDAISNLHENKELYNKIADNAYKLVKDNYSWEEISKKFINVCNIFENTNED
ncbi:glycosyltransferase [Candidatus Woesearchaeota archaeon]|nr:glycosyltransferase [Candidatus Woesearchaeota archaeon]